MTHTTDVRLGSEDIHVLASLMGKTLRSLYCDEFRYNPSTFQVAWLQTTDELIAIENLLRPLDRFGSTEEVAVLSVGRAETGERASRLCDTKLMEVAIDKVVDEVLLVNDHEWVVGPDGTRYEHLLTKAIIFDLGDSQLGLQKSIWFSEDMYVVRAQDALSALRPAGDGARFAEGCLSGASREVLSVGELVGGEGALG